MFSVFVLDCFCAQKKKFSRRQTKYRRVCQKNAHEISCQLVKNVLLRRFRNFARNRVHFKGTRRPTMKLLALSAEIPSPENLYIFLILSPANEMLLYNHSKREIRATILVQLLHLRTLESLGIVKYSLL